MPDTCTCCSGLPCRELYSIEGFFCCVVCDECEDEKRALFPDESFDADLLAELYDDED